MLFSAHPNIHYRTLFIYVITSQSPRLRETLATVAITRGNKVYKTCEKPVLQ